MNRLAHIHHRINRLNEPIWHVQCAIAVIIILQLILDSKLSFGPQYLVASIELGLLVSLMIIAYSDKVMLLRRTVAILLTSIVSLVNIVSLGLILHSLFTVSTGISGRDLLISAVAIYLSNIGIFALWYWEMDFNAGKKPKDFLFPQFNAPEHTGLHKSGWRPTFFDYLYVSTTNGTAFSPTDTMPLTHRAKLLMAVQALVSLAVVVLVTARAVGILS